jgi:hypothetical protein
LRDQTNRRAMEERVSRILVDCGRLDHIPKSIWATKANDDGKTIPDLLAEEVARKDVTNGKVGSRWWSGIFEEFGLQQNLELEEPIDDGGPSDELLEAMNAAHNPNPVQAKTKPMENYLAHCGKMGEACTFGVLNGIMTCPTLTVNMATTLHVALGKTWARTQTQKTIIDFKF